jgi:hypothetical protein
MFTTLLLNQRHRLRNFEGKKRIFKPSHMDVSQTPDT